MEYNIRMIKLGEHIKEVREKKKITQKQLITALQDRSDGSSIGRNSLINWEKGRVDNMRSHLKTLYAIGEILDIDINYFIGEQDHKSLDRRDVSLYTGLSDEAVENLHKISKDSQSSQIISAFFTSPHLQAILAAGMALEIVASIANNLIKEKNSDTFLLMFSEYDMNERKTELLKWITRFIDDVIGYDDLKYELRKLREGNENGKEES